jgi:hypothetical protein
LEENTLTKRGHMLDHIHAGSNLQHTIPVVGQYRYDARTKQAKPTDKRKEAVIFRTSPTKRDVEKKLNGDSPLAPPTLSSV